MPAGRTSEIVIEPRSWSWTGISEVWQYRELIYYFTWRDLKVKYKQTWIGLGWALAQPLFLVAVFTIFFANALRSPATSIPYPVFAMSGLVVWGFFSSGVTGAAASMASHASVIKKVYFPRSVIPVSSILTSLVDACIAFGVLVVLLIGYQVSVSGSTMLYAWPLAWLLSLVGTLGPGLLLSALNIKYKDVRHALPYLIQALFFLTPVIYSTSIFGKEWVAWILAINPMYAALYFLRLPIEAVKEPQALVLTSMISGVLLLAFGLIYFRRTERHFADLA